MRLETLHAESVDGTTASIDVIRHFDGRSFQIINRGPSAVRLTTKEDADGLKEFRLTIQPGKSFIFIAPHGVTTL